MVQDVRSVIVSTSIFILLCIVILSKNYKWRYSDLTLITCLIWITASNFLAINTCFSIYETMSWLQLICFWFALKFLTKVQIKNSIIFASLFSIALILIVTTVQIIKQIYLPEGELLASNVIKPTLLGGNGNNIGNYLVLIAITNCYLFFKAKRQKMIFVLLYIFCVVVVFNLESQASKILLILTPAVFAFFAIDTIKQKSKTLLFGLLFFAIVFATYHFYFSIYLGQGSSPLINELGQMDKRFEIWRAAIYMIADQPFTGVGIGQWQFHLDDYLAFDVHLGHPHNLFLELITELGLVGFGLISVFIFFCILGNKEKKFDPKLKSLAITSLIMILGFGLIYGTINHAHGRYKPMLFYAFACLAYLDQSKQIQLSLPKIIIAIFSLICIIYFSMMFHYNNSFKSIIKNRNKPERVSQLEKLYNPLVFTHDRRKRNIAIELLKLKDHLTDAQILKYSNIAKSENIYDKKQIKILSESYKKIGLDDHAEYFNNRIKIKYLQYRLLQDKEAFKERRRNDLEKKRSEKLKLK